MTSSPRQSPVPPAHVTGGFAVAHGTGGGPDGQPLVPGPASRGEARSAMLAYLGVPFTLFLLPLAVYLASVRGQDFARWHAGQALNASVTAILYSVCCLIAGAMLALDSLQVATFTAVPLLVVLWVSVLVTVVRAAGSASRGELTEIPRWLRLR